MKRFRKLIPAVVLLLVSAIMMSTATYAWFSMNNTVAVTGMEVKTKVSSNLLVAGDDPGATTELGDAKFTSVLNQTVQGILEPVSTKDAVNFYYTTDASASGAKVGSEAFYQYNASAVASDATKYGNKFSEVYGVSSSAADNLMPGQTKAVAYVDYVFQLKAMNTGSTPQFIDLTKLELHYNGAADSSKAHRIAIFVEDITGRSSSETPTALVGTYAVTSSANFDGKVVNGTADSALVDANYVGTSTTLATVEGNTTKYFKVVVRMWLEGQDKTCNNTTFMALTEKWTLEINLSLVDEVKGVTTITKTHD